MPTAPELRILLVDDHALFRQSVAHVLAAEPGIAIDHCASIREALQQLSRARFDLILLDHDLGNERASQFLPAARQAGFDGRVLIVTAWVSDNEARRLLRQGVGGIFLKHSPVEELVRAIRGVMEGDTWIDASLATDPSPLSDSAGATVFNDRELRALRFVVQGLSNKEIAWRLQISESYVKAILQSLFQKTGVRTRGQLVRVAFEQYEDKF